MIKLFVNFKTRDDPWGGINSFMKAFINRLEKRNDVTLLNEDNVNQTDIFLQGAFTDGYQELDLKYFENIFKLRKKHKFKFILRLDGLRAFYSSEPSPTDKLQMKLSKKADHIIFQSNASLEQFRKFGYKKKNYRVIYNGVNQEIFFPNFEKYTPKNKLKILSISWSSSSRKGFETISDFSLLENVEVSFVGRWNPDTPLNKVKLIEALPQKELGQIYRSNDVLLHDAENDSCPNVVLEALSCGLPILYNTTGGTPELATGYGLPILENTKDYYSSLISSISDRYPEFREKIIENIRDFSIEKATDRYMNYFEEILGLKSY